MLGWCYRRRFAWWGCSQGPSYRTLQLGVPGGTRLGSNASQLGSFSCTLTPRDLVMYSQPAEPLASTDLDPFCQTLALAYPLIMKVLWTLSPCW